VAGEGTGRPGANERIRVKEAQATGAEILITACPLCLIMLEDALKTWDWKRN